MMRNQKVNKFFAVYAFHFNIYEVLVHFTKQGDAERRNTYSYK